MVFVGSDPFLVSMDLFRKKDFSVFRWFDPYRRRDGSVLEGTICKQFVMSVKNRKNLKPCCRFKSFRSLVFRIQFMKKCVFGSSNPSTRRKIENGSMEIRKKLGAKKAEKSLEISAFLVFSRSDLNRPKDLARGRRTWNRHARRWRGAQNRKRRRGSSARCAFSP